MGPGRQSNSSARSTHERLDAYCVGPALGATMAAARQQAPFSWYNCYAQIAVAAFEFDPDKSRTNEKRHGISREEAQRLWNGTHILVPAKNVSGENRQAVLGRLGGKLYVAIFTERGEAIRLISCHRADKRWQRIWRQYVQGPSD